MTQKISWLTLIAISLLLVGLLVWPTESKASSASAVSGDATAVRLSGLVNLSLVKAGPIPSTGGSDSEELIGPINLTLGSILSLSTAGSLEADTTGNLGQGSASSGVDIVDLTLSALGLLNARVDTVDSATLARCVNGVAVCTAAISIQRLKITGLAEINASATTPPNTKLTIPGVGSVTINKQFKSQPNSKTCSITAMAAEIAVAPLGLVTQSIILAESHSDITCK